MAKKSETAGWLDAIRRVGIRRLKAPKTYWGIWDCEKNDWHRIFGGRGAVNTIPAFSSKAVACKEAAYQFGFNTYTEAKRKGWCEVRPLN